MACPPPSSPVMIVSAAHEAREAATAASAADPPAARISSPASAVAGWPAATAAITREVLRPRSAVGSSRAKTPEKRLRCYPSGRPQPRPHAFFLRGALGLRNRLQGGV